MHFQIQVGFEPETVLFDYLFLLLDLGFKHSLFGSGAKALSESL